MLRVYTTNELLNMKNHYLNKIFTCKNSELDIINNKLAWINKKLGVI